MAADLMMRTVRLRGLRLDLLCQGARYNALDTASAYIRGTQYARRRYDWDGAFLGNEGEVPVQASYYVSMSARRPRVRRDLPKLIVRRLTAMAFGKEQWPEIKVPGDPEAEDAAKCMVELSGLQTKVIEARWKGGSAGAVCASLAFVQGLPRIKVHEAKHIRVLEWKDRDEFVIARAIKVYRYERWEIVDGKPKTVWYYSARYWDEELEIAWDPIPEKQAIDGTWATAVRSRSVEHELGRCPLRWIQNLPDSEQEDGISDYDGMLERCDAINYLLSATHKGTVANVDPTLVIKDDQTTNTGVIRKGSESAIYSKGGAEYLELEGSAVDTAMKLAQSIEQSCLDEACVVNADPHEIASKAVSGEALKVVYMPMTAQCDILREQYGKYMIKPLIIDMLEGARRIQNRPLGPTVITDDGRVLQTKPTVILPPKYEEKSSKPNAEGKVEKTVIPVERTLGTSSDVQLNWRTYFPPTPADITAMVTSAVQAKGTLIAAKTAISYTAQVFGVKDVDNEEVDIETEKEATLEMMSEFAPPPGGAGKGGKEEDE